MLLCYGWTATYMLPVDYFTTVAHLTGGQGVVSSNLAAPTQIQPCFLDGKRGFLFLDIWVYQAYTN